MSELVTVVTYHELNDFAFGFKILSLRFLYYIALSSGNNQINQDFMKIEEHLIHTLVVLPWFLSVLNESKESPRFWITVCVPKTKTGKGNLKKCKREKYGVLHLTSKTSTIQHRI